VVDSLITIGSTVSSKDHIDVVLDGLPKEYDAFITSITSRLGPYTIEDFEALLLTQQERFEKHRSLEHSLIQANIVSTNWSSSPSSTSTFCDNSLRSGRGSFMSSNNKRHQSFCSPHNS